MSFDFSAIAFLFKPKLFSLNRVFYIYPLCSMIAKLIYEQPLGEMWILINDFYLFTDQNNGNE